MKRKIIAGFLCLLTVSAVFLGVYAADKNRKPATADPNQSLNPFVDYSFDAALCYGRACAAAGTALGALSAAFDIRERDVRVSVDFSGDGQRILAGGKNEHPRLAAAVRRRRIRNRLPEGDQAPR